VLRLLTRIIVTVGLVYTIAAWWTYSDHRLLGLWISYAFVLAATTPYVLMLWLSRSKDDVRQVCLFVSALTFCAVAHLCYSVLFRLPDADCGGLPCREATNLFFFAIGASLQLAMIALSLGVGALVRHLTAGSSGRAEARAADPGR